MTAWACHTVSLADVMEVFVKRCMACDELCDDVGMLAR
jgi:hypothetical protein